MIDFNGNEPPKNMNKLSVESKKKLINARSSSEILDIVMAERNITSPVAGIEEAEKVEEATHKVNPESYEANLNEQGDLLVEGSAYINDRIEELKESIKETEEKKNNPPKLKVEDLNVGETQNKNSIEHSEHDL